MTVDETWIHHYKPEMKEQSKPGERAPKKAETVLSAGKSWPPFFGIATITGQYYADLLGRFEAFSA